MNATMEPTTTIDIETILPWSAPKRVQTGNGPRDLRKAAPTDAFSDLWRGAKEALRAAGVSWSKDARTGQWEVCWWKPISAEEVQQAKASIEASRATDRTDVDLPVPDGLAYLPYQRAGIAFGMEVWKCNKGVLIADEMGLGKTMQAIGLINATPAIQSVLIICPNTLKINWHRELRKWLTRDMTVGIAHSKCIPSTDVVIINYDIVAKFEKSLSRMWDLVVMDEAHLCKNPAAQRSQAIFGYRPTKKQQEAGKQFKAPIPTKRRCALTGTPMLNKTMELFPMLQWLDPEKWTSGFKFGLRYAAGKSNGFGYNFSGASNLDELQRELRSTVMVRRLKKDVLKELPAKRRQVIEIPADGLEHIVGEEKAVMARWNDKLAAMKARVELAKVSDDAAGYAAAVAELGEGAKAAFTEAAKVAKEIAIAKVPMVVEHVREAIEGGKKVLLFAHHIEAIDRYLAAFRDVGAMKIDGSVSTEDRQRAVDAFQTDPDMLVIVLGIKAAGVGLTLTASSHVVFGELDWVPGNMTQCEDRAHRIGQTDSVLVQHLVLEGSLDVRKAVTLVEKQAIADKALDLQPGDVAESPALKTVLQVAALEAKEAAVPINCVTVSARELAAAVTKPLPAEEVDAIKFGLSILASFDEDKARVINGAGFSKADVMIGHSLAGQGRLSPKQAILGRKLVNKYRRQLPEHIVAMATRSMRKEKAE